MFVVKRRGIQDDIVGGVRRIVSPWLGAPPSQPRQVTRAQGVVRFAAETLDQTFAGGMVKAGVQGDKALVKQAAVNAAALGTGYIAGKAVQKALPLVQSKLGKEIGIHVSNTDKLRNITYSSQRAGTGNPGYAVDIEPGATYKFAPYRRTDYEVDAQGYISSAQPTEIIGRMDTKTFAKSVAANIQDMSRVTGNPTHKFAYITKSKPGINDEDWLTANAFTVKKQKVVDKVKLPQITVGNENFRRDWLADADKNYDQVKKVLYDALLKREQITQSNLRSNLNTVRGVTGVTAQQTGTKKTKRR